MVSTLSPAVHISGSQNVYGRAEGIADHYWPWAVFLSSTENHGFCAANAKGTMTNATEGANVRPKYKQMNV